MNMFVVHHLANEGPWGSCALFDTPLKLCWLVSLANFMLVLTSFAVAGSLTVQKNVRSCLGVDTTKHGRWVHKFK